MTRIEGILFDLDGTLIPEEEANNEAFLVTSHQAAQKHDLDPRQLAILARHHARKIFNSHPSFSYCQEIGAGSGESLCADFLGDHPELERLRKFAAMFRVNSWLNALGELGFHDPKLAQDLSLSFIDIRRSYYQLYPGVQELLVKLSPKFKTGIITNGFVDLQQEKIHLSGADQCIPHFIISGEVGKGKPHQDIFEAALAKINCKPELTLMVGNSLTNDILGASKLGIRTVYICGDNQPSNLDLVSPTFTIEFTNSLEQVISQIN